MRNGILAGGMFALPERRSAAGSFWSLATSGLHGWISCLTGTDDKGGIINVVRFFALASDPAESSIDSDLLGVAALPVAGEGLQSYSCAGGWNLFMNATRDPGAAYEFFRFLSASEQ